MKEIEEYKFKCSNCYGCPTAEEGCFTDDPEGMKEEGSASCNDGTWDDFDDDDNIIKKCDIEQKFVKNPLYVG